MRDRDIEDGELELLVKRALHDTADPAGDVPLVGGASCGHLDDLQISRFLSGSTSRAEYRASRDHLSECASCRVQLKVTAEVADELDAVDVAVSKPGWRNWRWHAPALAVAAAVLATLVGVPLVLQQRTGTESVDPFSAFIADDAANQLRSTASEAPTPVAPSFTKVQTTTPSFSWSAGPEETTRYRLLLIDFREELVGSREFAPEELGDTSSVEYPSSFQPLERGEIYAWKVDARVNGMWLPSRFVPFRVAGDAQEGAR